MTVVNPPTIVPNADRPPGDDLDGLLRSFYQAEIPNPWPAFQSPALAASVLPLRRPKAASRWNLLRSRLALAASILLLIAGAWLLFGGLNPSQDVPLRSLNDALPMGSRPQLPQRGPNIIVDPAGSRLQLEDSLDFIPMK